MTMDRENRVKFIQNVGKYLIDHADEIVPENKLAIYRQSLFIDLSIDNEIPKMTITTDCLTTETLKDVKWNPSRTVTTHA